MRIRERKMQRPVAFRNFSHYCLLLMLPPPCWTFPFLALASGGSLPITSLDATGNLVFANAGGTPNIVTAPLFLNPQNLSLLTSNPVSLVSAAAASAGASGPVASLHATSTSAESIQNSLLTVASASGATSTTTTASKAQWARLSCAASSLFHCAMGLAASGVYKLKMWWASSHRVAGDKGEKEKQNRKAKQEGFKAGTDICLIL